MKKKQSKADFLRQWKLPYPSFTYNNLRYKNPPEKGVYWYYLSLEVRKRDIEKWGTCISCGRELTWENAQAGHFMPAANCGRDLLFDLMNVHGECNACNGFDSTHLLGYSENLDRRYGAGTALSMRNRRETYRNGSPLKDWKGHEYADMIRKLPSYPHDEPSKPKGLVI